MKIHVVWIRERRHEDARVARTLLVHVVRDDRLVFVLHQLDVHARFFLREHEPIAVIVMADILVVQVREYAVVVGALGLVPMIDHEVLTVRVLRGDHQDDGVVEDLANLRRVLGGQAMNDMNDRLAV
jgi:hypothetical protein